MNDNKYWFISKKEWTEITREIESPNHFRYQTFSISLRKAKQLKRVSYFDADDYQPIIDRCLASPDSCHGLAKVFDLLANQYGAGHYLKSLPKQRKVLIDGLQNQHIVLLRETVTHSDYEPVQPTVIPEKMTYLTDEQFLVSHMEDPTNWIEFEVTGVANEPFTLFNSKTGEIVTQGQLDALGHAYVEIPEETVFLVDVAFSKTQEYRSWYYTLLDYHSQMFAGSVDAMASSLDALNDFHLADVVPIAKLYQVLGLSKYFSPNSSGGSKLMPAKTQGGELIRSASAFITGFYLLDLAGFSYIKPVSTFGQYSRGIAAFGVVNATVTPVMEHRIADLLSKDAGLKSVVLDYLSTHPDDSNAEARFKNGLEGLALGTVLEPLFIVFRIIKNTLTRTLITRIPTRRTYKLEAEQVEIKPIKPVESTEHAEIASDISKADKIVVKVESNAGKETSTIKTADGISFNIEQPKHLATVEGFSQKSAISGGHNADAFYEAVQNNGVKIISETPTSVMGITEVKYQIPAYDRAGNVIGYKEKLFTKTIYDPTILSDQEILYLGQQAATNGYKLAIASGAREYTASAGGMKFQVYLDPKTGTVTNFFPVTK
ncbi:CdiA family toxin C-terminal domain-containing protein [Orbus mooreae]|uniref:CdiA family toxin C-terminal domain-containing protein n=1 Tax=Orbus mooreae TaxID=3074107 RepID=UPI00370DB5E5